MPYLVKQTRKLELIGSKVLCKETQYSQLGNLKLIVYQEVQANVDSVFKKLHSVMVRYKFTFINIHSKPLDLFSKVDITAESFFCAIVHFVYYYSCTKTDPVLLLLDNH